MGFEAVPIEYVREERAAGKTKYTLKKMIRLACDGIFNFSSKPLELPFGFGVALGIERILAMMPGISPMT